LKKEKRDKQRWVRKKISWRVQDAILWGHVPLWVKPVLQGANLLRMKRTKNGFKPVLKGGKGGIGDPIRTRVPK